MTTGTIGVMSGGHRNLRATSGLPQTADMAVARSLFSLGPEAGIQVSGVVKG